VEVLLGTYAQGFRGKDLFGGATIPRTHVVGPPVEEGVFWKQRRRVDLSVIYEFCGVMIPPKILFGVEGRGGIIVGNFRSNSKPGRA
jgi:hypothetical protein